MTRRKFLGTSGVVLSTYLLDGMAVSELLENRQPKQRGNSFFFSLASHIGQVGSNIVARSTVPRIIFPRTIKEVVA